MLLLMRDLNFVPTPNWSRKVENDEWHNAHQHIRRFEWNTVETEEQTALPKKLKITCILDWTKNGLMKIPSHTSKQLLLSRDI